MTDAQFLLSAWIVTALIGAVVALRMMVYAAEDKAFLRALHLNGVRAMLVDVNFSEALSKFVFKFVYGMLGLWTLALRAQNSAPLTLIGWLAFTIPFLPILWFTVTDVYNFRRKQMIVQGFVRDNIEFVKVQVPEPAPTMPDMSARLP